jgi:hypothetical protein
MVSLSYQHGTMFFSKNKSASANLSATETISRTAFIYVNMVPVEEQ